MSLTSTEQAMQDAGVPIEEPVYADYWSFDERPQWFFPDNKQWIEFKALNEGERKEFQKLINKDLTIKRATGDATVRTDVAEERYQLVMKSVTNWNVYRNGQPVPFGKEGRGSMLAQWLEHTNPKLVDDLEFAIRKANPWMQSDNMSIEEIDKEIDRLTELRKQIEERELEKARS